MIKLNKTKLNELLYYISSDNFKNSLILKLIYVYGRNAREVFNLKPEDVDLTIETILFTIPTGTVTFPLVEDIRDVLMGYIYDHGISPDEYVFREVDETMEIAIKKLNYYLPELKFEILVSNNDYDIVKKKIDESIILYKDNSWIFFQSIF